MKKKRFTLDRNYSYSEVLHLQLILTGFKSNLDL